MRHIVCAWDGWGRPAHPISNLIWDISRGGNGVGELFATVPVGLSRIRLISLANVRIAATCLPDTWITEMVSEVANALGVRNSYISPLGVLVIVSADMEHGARYPIAGSINLDIMRRLACARPYDGRLPPSGVSQIRHTVDRSARKTDSHMRRARAQLPGGATISRIRTDWFSARGARNSHA